MMLRLVAVVAFGLGLAPTAAAAPLSIASAVEPGSHAAAFRWTTSAPAITTVEVGRNDVFGIWLRTPKQPRAGGSALLGSLEPGTTYRYRVTARRGPRYAAGPRASMCVPAGSCCSTRRR